jgi:hypothetical protein
MQLMSFFFFFFFWVTHQSSTIVGIDGQRQCGGSTWFFGLIELVLKGKIEANLKPKI